MDHLSGINWNSSPAPKPASTPAASNAFANLSLKPSPLTSRSASPGIQPTPQNGAQKVGSAPKGGDSFASLVSFGRGKQTSNLTLLEQQQQLEEQRRKDTEESRKKMDALFGGGSNGNANSGFWDALDNGRPTSTSPAPSTAPPAYKSANDDDEDDLLAAFNAAVPVDNSSHYPPPTNPTPPPNNIPPLSSDFNNVMGVGNKTQSQALDPFNIDNLPSRDPSPYPKSGPRIQADDEFDILGDLAKPLSELAPRPEPTPSPKPQDDEVSGYSEKRTDPRDPAIAEIMDMGFTSAQAKAALAETDTGLDVQVAVSWLLDQAHGKSKPASRTSERNPSRQDSGRSREDRSMQRRAQEDPDTPAWAKKDAGQKDVGAIAAEVSGSLFKSANSLWSAAQKKVEKAVAEYKADMADTDPNMPKWMREQKIREELEARGAKGISRQDRPPPDEPGQKRGAPEPVVTDEALMLEMGSGPPERRKQKQRPAAPPKPSQLSQREQIQLQRQQAFEAAVREKERELVERQQKARSVIPDSASRKARLAAEEAEPVYVSRNRRRPPPASASSKTSTPEPDLLGGGGSNNPFAREAAAERSSNPSPASRPQQPTRPSQPSRPTPAPASAARRSPPPKRTIPALSPQSLASSTASRQKGTESFKLGDFTAACTHYTHSLTPLPPSHPLRIVSLTNRSLCHLKLGDPKSALTDISELLTIIGTGQGENETIPPLEPGSAPKPMKDYYTKALTRKAEALEQLEKYTDAKQVWELLMPHASASAGKRRCEAALAPAARARAPPPPRPVRRPTAPAAPSTAVKALRAANAASATADEERLALYDSVDARINAWKHGKDGNLRALLAGLDGVLWEGCGWKKVGMGDLIIPAKCKIAYMRGISKVHPDKIPKEATTEQRMISAAVFTLLNDAWDKFKAENNL